MPKLHVFLIDDHAALREGLRLLVDAQTDMVVVGQAGDGREALRMIADCAPDVIVVDVTMPDIGGAQFTERLQARCPHLRVVALTRHTDPGYMRRMFEAGASGYVTKRAAAEELIVAIRTVAAGGTYVDPSMAHLIVNPFVARASNVDDADPLPAASLNERERHVLKLTAWGHSNKEIAAEVGVSVKTIEYYKARAMDKLSLASRTDIVRYAVGQGWMQES